MSDKPDIDIPNVIAAAISAAGERGGNRSDAAWRAAVDRAIPFIIAMMGEGSHQSKIATEVATAQVFTSVYLGYEVEESSTRCVVNLETRVSDDHPDGVEQMRTHRTDSAQGEAMKARLNALEKGDAIIVWKAMEKMGNDRKVRVFVHFEKTWKKKEERPSDPEPVTQLAQKQSEDALTDSIDTERLHRWREGAAKVIGQFGYAALVEQLESKGYDINGVSEVEWDSTVRPIIREIRKDLNE